MESALFFKKRGFSGNSAKWESGSILLRGVLGLCLGVVSLYVPGITLLSFLHVLAAYCLIEGAVAVLYGLEWLSRASGALSIILGVALFAGLPNQMASCIFLIGLWMVLRGAFDAARATSGSMLGTAGFLSVFFGVLCIAWPLITNLSLSYLSFVYLISAYSVVYGTLICGAGIRSSKPHKEI